MEAVLGETVLTVADEKVSIIDLKAQVVSSLSLSLHPSPGNSHTIIAKTAAQQTLNFSKQVTQGSCRMARRVWDYTSQHALWLSMEHCMLGLVVSQCHTRTWTPVLTALPFGCGCVSLGLISSAQRKFTPIACDMAGLLISDWERPWLHLGTGSPICGPRGQLTPVSARRTAGVPTALIPCNPQRPAPPGDLMHPAGLQG